MKCDPKDLLLYAVTDRHWLNGRTLVDVVKESLDGGVTMIQLREKSLDEGKFLEEAKELQALCRERHVPFIVNDNVDIAKAMDADGVHVGQDDMAALDARAKLGPDKILGVTAKTVAQALEAEKAGADYLGSGAVFPSPTKTEAIPMSRETLTAICQSVSIPVVAIGGINASNLSTLAGTGIAGAAIISGIFGQPDIGAAVRELRECIHKNHRVIPTVLTIAGSDSGGGAGIQADLKTMMANGVYAMSVITALTAQNTMGVSGIMEVTPEFLKKQLDAVFTDIKPDAVKIGMVASAELIHVIAERLSFYKPKFIVVDPVMVSTSGSRLIEEDAVAALQNELLPMASVITPNIPETEVLIGTKIDSKEKMEQAAQALYNKYETAVLCKGGHSIEDANDYLYGADGGNWLESKRIDNENTHGTGCTLSSAIASYLAQNCELTDAVIKAKEYISGALADGMDLGQGSGPLNHAFRFNPSKN